MNPTIVFDFDGTLALGDGPITAFARQVAERSGKADFGTRAAAALAAFEAGAAGSGDIEYRDGYDAVTRSAQAEGVSAEIIGASYEASRALLGSDNALVVAPAGLAAFLARIGAHARLVLATNAPGETVTAVLHEWGVADAFEAMHFAVGKPTGLVPVIRDALERGPVLAVGDIVEFDLAPVTELGGDTALVGSTALHSTADVTMRATSLTDLYDAIELWARTAAETN